MLADLLEILPADALHLALVMSIAFFIGLEREEHKQQAGHFSFGGVRTFPLIGIVSYALAFMSDASLWPWLLGFAVVGGLMMLSYYHKCSLDPSAGLTSEVSALATYVVGGLVHQEHYWFATTVGVVSVLLLELKNGLEGLTKRIASSEIVTVAKFALLCFVILPVIPNHEFTDLHFNPFKAWLVVVAVSGVSFASYLLQRLLKGRGGVLLSAVLGGAYSSTVTTVVLARQAKQTPRPNLFSGSILAASSVMYLRLVLLLAFFDRSLAWMLAIPFVTLAVVGGLVGWLVSRRPDDGDDMLRAAVPAKNPLEIGTALLFAAAFVVILALTNLAHSYLGSAGLYALAAVMGLTDVDPFILGLAQGGRDMTPLPVAATAIVIAAASNNVLKAIYAYVFADRQTGIRSLVLLLSLAALSLLPLFWI